MLELKKFDNIGEAPISTIMRTKVFCIQPSYTIKSTIETFKVHHISCAPVTSDDGKILGIISEHDLLLQAASKSLSLPIDYNSKVTALSPGVTIKSTLLLFFSKKLKHIPVINNEHNVVGIVSRIDLLNYLVTSSA
jgi:predicted transcriptional regulator